MNEAMPNHGFNSDRKTAGAFPLPVIRLRDFFISPILEDLMPEHTETLADGGELHVTKSDWFIRYDHTPKRLDSHSDMRYLPRFRDLRKKDITCYAETIVNNWREAERLQSRLPLKGGRIRKFVMDGMTIEANETAARLILPHGLVITSENQAIKFEHQYRRLISQAEERQKLLYEINPNPVPDPDEALATRARCEERVLKWRSSRQPTRILIKVSGIDINEAKTELGALCRSIDFISIAITQNVKHEDLCCISFTAPNREEAKRLVSDLLVLWNVTTKLRAEVHRCTDNYERGLGIKKDTWI